MMYKESVQLSFDGNTDLYKMVESRLISRLIHLYMALTNMMLT